MHPRPFIILAIYLAAILPVAARASADDAWAEKQCAYRRPVTVIWDSGNPTGAEMAQLDFLTAGRAKPDGGDIRVTTQNGSEIPSRVLMMGPGDTARIVFSLSPGVEQYDVYFGNPAAPPPQDVSTFPITRGLLLETRTWNNQTSNQAAAFESIWNASGPLLGRTMVDLPFIAGNPLGYLPGSISRYTGKFSVPQDGQYTFAASTGTWGALYVDGQPILFAAGLTPHADYQVNLDLSRGWHDFVFYQIFIGDQFIMSVAWRLPGATDFTTITRDYFGLLNRARPGDLESQDGKPLADFSAEYQASTPTEAAVSHRYTFTAAGADPNAQWDFGDGQTATGATVDHVYLSDGIYPVQIRQRNDLQTTQLPVHADFTEQIDPPIDPLWVEAKIVADYQLDKIPASQLAAATVLEADAENWPTADRLAARLARAKSHGPGGADAALDALRQIAARQPDWQTAARVWQLVPDDSDLQPQAAIDESQWLLWSGADFDRAAQRLATLAATRPFNPQIQQAFAEALILDQQPDRGRKILNSLPKTDDPRRRPAVSGAFARSVEFYISQRDPDSARDAWNKWDAADPTAFPEGYSILLQVRIMALRQLPIPAAKVAEAFATALPQSPYSPELLDTASKLLATLNSAKSQQLRDLLKQKYPEDPLSQN
ncbi:MAG: PKD domain-containing protein [Tepidisphaeraceae bacterium]|jgi:hypothetical protein